MLLMNHITKNILKVTFFQTNSKYYAVKAAVAKVCTAVSLQFTGGAYIQGYTVQKYI